MEYANRNNIMLTINNKDKKYHHYPLYNAVAEGNNIEMVKLLINYANRNSIILGMEDNIAGKNPLSWAISQNNIKMVELLLEYTSEKGIKLELKEAIIENTIMEYHKHDKNKCVVNSIFELEPKIIRLLNVHSKNNQLNIVYNMKNSYKSPLFKRIEENI